MKKTLSENRNQWLHVRITLEEMERIKLAIASTTERKVSTYARKMILGQPVILKTRNASIDDFLQELTRLKRELSSIGSNFNQLVKKINTFKDTPEGKIWFPIALEHQKQLTTQINTIQTYIHQFARQWFPK